MGNSASAEAPRRKSLKATNKLSKPKIGNPVNSNNLLSTNGFTESTRRLPKTDVLPVRPSASPFPSPVYASAAVDAGPGEAAGSLRALNSQTQLSRSHLSSDPTQDHFNPARHDRRGSTGTIGSQKATRPVRTNSMVVNSSEWGSQENARPP